MRDPNSSVCYRPSNATWAHNLCTFSGCLVGKTLENVIGYEKKTTLRKTRFLAIFQAVTIPKPQEPQASHLVYRQFGPSTLLIQR